MTYSALPEDYAARALSLCIMQPTVSGGDAGIFRRLHTLLRQLFPRLFSLCTAIAVHFPGTVIVPSLLAGGTDARRMEALCPQVYRFSPFILPQDELLRVHGIDERLSLENLNRGVAFFRQMLQA